MFARVLLATAALLTASSSAQADVAGKRRRCPEGTHHEYWRGHHCVRDGWHYDPRTESEVPDDASSASAPAEPPGTRKTCAVTSPGVNTGEAGVLGVMMALAASALRQRQRAS